MGTTLVHSVHLPDELVDIALAVSVIASLHVVLELACSPATGRVRELEGPQKVGGLLEVGPNSEDFVNEILDGKDIVFAQSLLNDCVARKWHTLLVDLAVSTLVDQLTNSLQIGLAIGDVWLNQLQHLLSSLVDLEEDAIVDLEEAEKLEDFAWFWCNLAHTLDADNKVQLGISWYVEVTGSTSSTLEADLLLLAVDIFLYIGLCPLEENSSLGHAILAGSGSSGELFLSSLLILFSLLEKSFWDVDVLRRRDSGRRRHFRR